MTVLGAVARPARSLGVVAGAVVVLALLVAALPWLWDNDPARTVLRTRYAERAPDPATLDALRRELDLPANPVLGALGWLGGLLRGDLGLSWVSRDPVGASLGPAVGVSLTLAVGAAVVAVLVALAVLVPGLRRAAGGGRPTRRPGAVTAGVLGALPEIALGAVLVTVVGVAWRLLPTSGWAGPANLVLPALALGVPAGGLLARVLSAAVDATAAEAWVRTWRATATPPRVVAAAIARRAVAVAVPQLALLVVGLLGSAVAVERLFGIPGLGSLALDATLAQDLPVVQAAVSVLVVLGLALGALGVAVHRAVLGAALTGAEVSSAAVDDPGSGRRAPLVPAAVLAIAVGVGLLRDPSAIDPARARAAPSLALPLGGDTAGRDVLARFAHGALLTVGAAVTVSVVCLAVGLLVGIGTRGDRAGVADVLNALPPVFVGLLVAAVAGPGLLGASLAVAAVGWVPLAVHARTLATEARASGYVRAALLAGASDRWIARRHVLPAVTAPVLRHALARVPHAALGIAALSFLGLGAAPDSPEWGAMLAEALGSVERAPWAVAAPVTGLVLLAIVVALVRDRPRSAREA